MRQRLALGVVALLAAVANAEEPTIETLQVEVAGQAIHGRAAGPADGPGVLLLHGAAFDSGTWEELGTLRVLADAGLRAVAIDLPGYARSKAARADPQTFLAALIPALGIEAPVLVSPSMSGSFSFPLVLAAPERLGGFVPVAPVQTPRYARRIRGSKLPALIVWGEKDRLFPTSQAELLAACFEDARVLILPGARHPAYLDRPDAFHEALVGFAKRVRRAR